MARFWYAYIGGDIFSPTSYNQSIVKPSCISGCKVCAIYSPGAFNPTAPLSSHLRSYMIRLLMSSIAQPDDPGFKIYLYGKNC